MNVVKMPNQEQDLIIYFSDFWEMYPRRVAKKDARKAWEKIPPRLHAEILTALFEWRRIWLDRNEIEFIPHPSTWLNGERWEDDFPPWHKPYTQQQQLREKQQSMVEEKERKLMPLHIKDALKKIREQS